MRLARLSYQPYDNLLLEVFGKPHHLARSFLAQARAELLNQLSCQRYDNLLSTLC